LKNEIPPPYLQPLINTSKSYRRISRQKKFVVIPQDLCYPIRDVNQACLKQRVRCVDMEEMCIVAYHTRMSHKVKTEFDRYVSYISKMSGVLQIYLFGSYAYGEPTDSSDIDILVIVQDGVNTLKFMQSVSRGLYDRKFALDVLADNISDFTELSEPERFTLQREVKDKGVLVYG